MKKKHSKTLFFLVIIALMAGGATELSAGENPLAPFRAVDLNPKLKSGKYAQKVDNFMVILDGSGTMADPYGGQAKFNLAKATVSHMNQTIPDLQIGGSLRKFADEGNYNELKPSVLLYGPARYSKSGFEGGLNAVKYARGGSPLASAIEAASKDLASTKGSIALIIVSDATQIEHEPVIGSAEKIKAKYGERLCMYTVQVGNDPAGQKLLKRVAQVGGCGYYLNADHVVSGDDMAIFVERVFLVEAVAATPTKTALKDSDADGVPDYYDNCENTPTGATVDLRGCWVYRGSMMFGFDNADLRPEAIPALDEAARVMKMHPNLKVEIQGHTDNVGSAEYNQKLSERRAKAVADYLIGAGIDSNRLRAVGYGKTKPIHSNDTAGGRDRNRRVSFEVIE